MKYIGCIYRHWIINDKGIEKSYIGLHSGEQPERDRWGKDGSGYRPQNGKEPTKFYNAINKYGWSCFQHDIIEWVEAETIQLLMDLLKEKEIYYIQQYDSYYNGYNSTLGGEGVNGHKHSEESKKKMSEARKGKCGGELHPMYGKHGKNNPNYGKERSEETKQKISEALKGKYTGEKASAYYRRGELSPMYGKTGELNPFYGHKHTEETKNKISEALKGKTNTRLSKKVRCLNTGQVFINQRVAGEWCNLKTYNKIGACCRHERNYAGRHPETNEQLQWEYYEG